MKNLLMFGVFGDFQTRATGQAIRHRVFIFPIVESAERSFLEPSYSV